MIRTVIIDDEINIRTLIRDMLQSCCPDILVTGEAGSVKEGLELLSREKPDLLLLDIQLEDGNGFELLAKVGTIGFRIIFITAYEEFALRALKLSAVDYLLKPISIGELQMAVEKARQFLLPDQEMKVNALVSNFSGKTDADRKIVLRTYDKHYFVSIREVIRCESDSSYTKFFLLDGREIMVSQTMKEYEEILLPFRFFRPHKSFLINLEHVRVFEKSGGGYIVMSDGSNVPLSEKKRDEFFRMMKTLS